MILSRHLLFPLFLLFCACGFHPVYEKQRSDEPSLTEVRVAEVPGRSGQIFRSHLEDLLNPSAAVVDARYEARSTLGIKLDALIIEPDGTISTFRVSFNSKLTLVDLASGKIIHQEAIKRSNRYTVSAADYSTYVAEGDAIEREAEALSGDYFMAIAAFLKSYHGGDLSNAPLAPPLAASHVLPPPSGPEAISPMQGIAPDSPSLQGGIVTPGSTASQATGAATEAGSAP